ncbi:hypothetical protein BKH43_05135 [Helicobacter sp. 13S00401-1]|uniref:F0F1 ATP synthase subunit B family protein n=1 Tax=Helicobacter sp. 13S00401-1 TaxID=1905758 RepID=UPI000BA6B2F3|nr:hypothetical protein [Helicobacter sp. 13S00401-1]PAF50286.1 hypothetical protein BKH43_05135 [Helicobacter sp. 13S00401-1]
MLKLTVIFAFFSSAFIFAADHPMVVSHTDITPRLMNFILFIILLWFLVADKFKVVLKERSEGILKQLDDAQKQSEISKEKLKKAQIKLQEAKVHAEDIVATTRKEVQVMAEHINAKAREQIAHLAKANEEAEDFEYKAFEKAIITEILQEAFSSKEMDLDIADYLNILDRKVA